MANGIAIVAHTGYGKSTAIGHIPELDIQGLDPKETFIVNVKGKPLPFKGWKKAYETVPNGAPPDKGNYLATTKAKLIVDTLEYINANRSDIKNVVLDDFQYIMSEQFMSDALKKGYDKFNVLAKNAFDVINAGLKMRDDINFFVLTHAENTETTYGTDYKIKTIGKMLDDKITLEGLFTIVLYGRQTFDGKEQKTSKMFVTNYDGQYPAKSPVGMFGNVYIPNDLGYVVQHVNSYYHGD